MFQNRNRIFSKSPLRNPFIFEESYRRRCFYTAILRNILRITAGTALVIGGGGAATYKLKESLPDFGKYKLPDFGTFNLPETIKYKDALESFTKLKDFIPFKYFNGTDSDENLSSSDVKAMLEIEKSMTAIIKEDKSKMSEEELEVQRNKEELLEMHKQFELEKRELEDEIEILKRQLLMDHRRLSEKQIKIKKSLIEMYNDVLDTLDKFEELENVKDELPRVVVVGEQSAGKTSVLEMIARARLFPRGSGSMTTRAPVKVMLAEGPYPVAKFLEEGEDSEEYDLSCVEGQEKLRGKLEALMNLNENTITKQPISLSVKGPNINRAVLVDLPGIINTNTEGMDANTRQTIQEISEQYMSNPNAIIVCVIDASRDPENNAVVDLVSRMDHNGSRTIVVLNKIDRAENQLSDPDRIKKILAGEVFRLKSRGYYAVIAGKDGDCEEDVNSIKKYEEEYFRSSKLLKDHLLNTDHLTTGNLSRAVSQIFWRMVKDNVETQLNKFRALKLNLETEWRNKYRGLRELNRHELFEKARSDMLDNVVELSIVSPNIWEDKLNKALWNKVKETVFETIYFPSHQATDFGKYKTTLENQIMAWTTGKLGQDTIEVGWECVKDTLHSFSVSTRPTKLDQSASSTNQDSRDKQFFEPLYLEIEKKIFSRHLWDNKALPSLRIIQSEAMHDTPIRSKKEWDEAVSFLEQSLKQYLGSMKGLKEELKGPGSFESWWKWTSKSEEQRIRSAVFKEIEQILHIEPNHTMKLSDEELTTIKRNLRLKKLIADDSFIKETWLTSYKLLVLERALLKAVDCQKGYYHYHYGFEDDANFDCRDVLFFHRLQRLFNSSSNALRNQIMNNEVQRLDKITREVLTEINEDPEKLRQLISGNRVDLAEKIKTIKTLIEKSEDFIGALNREK